MNHKALGVISLSLSAMVLGGCGYSEPRPFDPQAIARIQKEEAMGAPRPHLRPLPTTIPSMEAIKANRVDPATTRPSLRIRSLGEARRLTLQQIIHLTAANNRDARVAGYQSAIDEARILEAEARFDPTAFAELDIAKSFPQGFQPIELPQELLSQSLAVGLRQQLESGGQLELRYQSTRTEFDRLTGFTTEGVDTRIYDNALTLKLTQPLLRDFGTATNMARITIARNDQKISQLDFRDQLEKVIEQVEETYWKLYEAERTWEIERQLLKDSEEQFDILRRRMVQDVGEVQLAQAQTFVQRRALLLVDARGRVEDLSDQLKRLMNDPDLPIASPVLVLPADAPVEEPVEFNQADQIEAGLQNRLELKQQMLRIDSAWTVIGAAKNNLLPKLDLVASIGAEGLSEADFKTALENGIDKDSRFVPYSLGFQFEVPIGNRQARAIYQRTLLQHAQAIEQWRLQVDQVTLDVKLAANEVERAWERIGAARTARFAAEDYLRSLDRRIVAGEPLRPEFLNLRFDAQSQLADAKQQEAQAVGQYNVALSALEKAKGTILRYNHVELREEPGPLFSKFGREMWGKGRE